MCKYYKGVHLSINACIIVALLVCLVKVKAATSSTCSSSSSNCTLREWLTKLQDEYSSLECTLSQLEKSTTLLSKVNYSTTTMRLTQITKLKKSMSNLKGEIDIINSTCSTFYGPDCNQTTPECDSKCISCASAGQCSVCSGNWDGPTCSVCKPGWNGTLCNIPICDSKCLNCLAPNTCSSCTGNWNGTTCSVCKSGWNGTDCNTPVCSPNCASCSAPNICPTCKSGWYGSDCNRNTPLILTSAQITKFTSLIMSNATISSSKLLFKASRDGFSASAFHSKCDNKGPTIVIVKATTGAIFGGYTSQNWYSGYTGWVSDSYAFIFSLVSSTNVDRFAKLYPGYSLYGKTNQNSIYTSPSYGPIIGGGFDLYISDNCNSNSNSYSNVCHSYCDTTMAFNTDASRTYLAGSISFQVEDYEVFSF